MEVTVEVEVEVVGRSAEAFQQQVPVDRIDAMCRRAFGDDARPARVVEIGMGTYNTTYRIEFEGREPVILRVAPDRDRQPRGHRDAMRNEYAAAPYFAALGPLVPRILAVDFTHQLVDRDHMFQAVLDGVPAAEHLASYPPARLGSYYRQLGSITRAIHDVPGERFGRVAGPGSATWSGALEGWLRCTAAEFDDAGLDPHDVRRLVDAIDVHRSVLDEVTEPRLLHGDLWQLNILLAPEATEPTITGILDSDGAAWGDPLADWTIHRVRQLRGTGADAFWDTYGQPPDDAGGAVRELFYRARNMAGVRLDIHRRGIDLDGVPPVHWDLTDLLARLDA